MRIALLGFGLIGGSIARALHERDGSEAPLRVVAWSPSGAGPASAERDGVIAAAAASPIEAIADADLIVLAGPAPVVLTQLDDLAGPWRSAVAADAVITDVASTKASIVRRAAGLGLRFVGGHPMAGREASGYGAAQADLFHGRPWVVVPGSADEEAVARVERLALAVGAQPRRLDAAEHDDAVAGVSHLPLVVSAALVEAVAGAPPDDRPGWTVASQLAAGGWRDMTRLARGDIAMGKGILTTNAPSIAARVHDMITVLEGWLADLERDGGADGEAVERRLRAARDRLESMQR